MDHTEAKDRVTHALNEINKAEKKKLNLIEELSKIEPLAIEAEKNYELVKKAVQDLTVYYITYNYFILFYFIFKKKRS
jgi:plasmid maintenance system killer protein